MHRSKLKWYRKPFTPKNYTTCHHPHFAPSSHTTVFYFFIWTILSFTSSPLGLLIVEDCLPHMSGSSPAKLNLPWSIFFCQYYVFPGQFDLDKLPRSQLLSFYCENIYRNTYIDYQKKFICSRFDSNFTALSLPFQFNLVKYVYVPNLFYYFDASETVLYKLFHSVLDQIISCWITAQYTSPLLFPFMHFAIL